MKSNSAMRRIVSSGLPPTGHLPSALVDVLDGGWVIGPAGSLLLKVLFGSGGGWRADWKPEDVAQEEYEVNDVHVPSDGVPTQREVFQAAMASRALAFVAEAMRKASTFEAGHILTAGISISDDNEYLLGGTTVKFFTRRGNYPKHLEGDLERYQLEAIAVLDTADAKTLKTTLSRHWGLFKSSGRSWSPTTVEIVVSRGVERTTVFRVHNPPGLEISYDLLDT